MAGWRRPRFWRPAISGREVAAPSVRSRCAPFHGKALERRFARSQTVKTTVCASSPCFSSLNTEHTEPRTAWCRAEHLCGPSADGVFRARRAHRDFGTEEKSSHPNKKFRSGSTTRQSRKPTGKLRRPGKLTRVCSPKVADLDRTKCRRQRGSLCYAAALSWPTAGPTPSCCIRSRASQSALCSAIFPPLIRKVTVPT